MKMNYQTIQVNEEGENKYHQPSSVLKKQRLILNTTRLCVCIFFSLIVFSLVAFILPIISNPDYFEKSIINPSLEKNMRIFNNWQDYVDSTMECRETTKTEIEEGQFRVYKKDKKIFYLNITNTIIEQKKILDDYKEFTNFITTNPLLKKEIGTVPCICSFKSESGEIISIVDPYIKKTSETMAELNEILPILKSEKTKKVIPTSIEVTGYYYGNKLQTSIISRLDVNTILNCLKFQRKIKQ